VNEVTAGRPEGAMTHQDLCESLAHAKDTPYINAPLGSMWSGQDREHIREVVGDAWLAKRGGWKYISTQIADVVRIRPSYTQFCVDVFEVKRTRSDLLGDLRKEKWRGYLPHCHRIYFACMKGIVKASEIPEPAGLWLYDEKKGWYCSKGAETRSVKIPMNTILSFLFWKRANMGPNSCQRCSLATNENRLIDDPYYWEYFDVRTKKLKKLGEDLAPALKIVREERERKSGVKGRRRQRHTKPLDKTKKV